MFRKFPAVFLLVVLGALIATPAQAVQRAFVASFGNNANTATGCPVTAPCRNFFAAITVVDPNGEVVALDTAAYGAVTLTQSVSLTAAPGAYAGISVFPGADGVTIATPGISVTLRGLTINSQGGTHGISMTAGTKLSIENCVISNFSSGSGVFVSAAAKVRMVNTLVRDNMNGVWLENGATADISGSQFLGNSAEGIIAIGNTASTTTTASVSDSVVTGSNFGIDAFTETASATAQVYVIRSTVTNNSFGISSESTAGTASLTLSDSMVTGNATGLNQVSAGATLESLGNNTVRKNTANTAGTITTVAPI